MEVFVLIIELWWLVVGVPITQTCTAPDAIMVCYWKENNYTCMNLCTYNVWPRKLLNGYIKMALTSLRHQRNEHEPHKINA